MILRKLTNWGMMDLVLFKGKIIRRARCCCEKVKWGVSGQDNNEFKNEVLLLAKLQHRNLVRLIGFAMEGMERVLIYKYVQNASLDQFIFVRIQKSGRSWIGRNASRS